MRFRKLAGGRALMEFRARFVGDVLAAGDVNCLKPSVAAPAPGGHRRDAKAAAPLLKGSDPRTWIFVRYTLMFHCCQFTALRVK